MPTSTSLLLLCLSVLLSQPSSAQRHKVEVFAKTFDEQNVRRTAEEDDRQADVKAVGDDGSVAGAFTKRVVMDESAEYRAHAAGSLAALSRLGQVGLSCRHEQVNDAPDQPRGKNERRDTQTLSACEFEELH